MVVVRTLVRLVLLLSLLAFGLPAVAEAATAARATPVSGRLVTEGGQLTSLAGSSQVLPFTLWCERSVFSPSGAMIASVRPSPTRWCQTGVIQIHRAHGRTTTLPALPGRIEGLTWSPDGRHLAALIASEDLNGSGLRNEIYVFGVDGSGRRLLYSGDGGAGSPTRDLAWSPDGSRIAFVGSSRTTRTNADQIYTIPAAGGTPSPYNVSLHDPACADQSATCRVLSFSNPRWSPDGATMLVNVTDAQRNPLFGSESATASVATITEGESEPHVVRAISARTSDAWYGDVHPSLWSADGSAVVSPEVSHVGAWGAGTRITAVRTDLASGKSVPVGSGVAYDWQPCPTGTCVAWPRAPRPRVAFTAFWKDTAFKHLRLAAKVSPRQHGFLRVELQVGARGRWIPYLSKNIDISSGRVTRTAMASRDDPPGEGCRAVATYRQVFRKVVRAAC